MKAKKVRFDIRRQGAPILLGLIVLIVLNTLAWAALIRPKAADYFDRTKDGGGEKLQELRDNVAKVENAESYIVGLGQAEQDLEYLRREVLGTRAERLVEIQREITRIGAEFRIDINSVSTKNEDLRDEGIDRLAMIVPLQGGYANLRRFLQAIEASDKFLVVERVALDGAARGAAAGNLNLNITVATYFTLPTYQRPAS